MRKEMPKKTSVKLLIVILLPLFIPYAGRKQIITPILSMIFSTVDGTLYPWLIFPITILILPYWAFVGSRFYHAGVSFPKSLFIGNIPIWGNFISETIYYVIFHQSADGLILIPYFLGAYIDKFHPLIIFGEYDGFFSIVGSSSCLILAFAIGYCVKTIDTLLRPLMPPGMEEK